MARVVGVLGAGGASVVYEVLTARGETAAWKVGLPGAEDRLRHEVEALRRLEPPQVPALFEAGVRGAPPWLLMERLPGQSLATRMAEQLASGLPAPEELLRWGRAVTGAVAAAHARGVCHRDVKPENLWLRENDAGCLLDFGLWQPSRGSAPGTHPSSFEGEERAGTWLYMAPEQCLGAGPIRPAADVYALGAVLFELATGSPPFFGDAAQLREAHVHRRAPLLSQSGVSWPSLEAVISRCLEKDPERRFQDAQALAEALEPLAASGARATGLTAAPGSAPERVMAALLALETERSLPEITEEVRREGGVLAAVVERPVHSRLVLAFPSHGEVRSALEAAERTWDRLGAGVGVLHLAEVRTRSGGGTVRLSGEALTSPQGWWGAEEGPAGLRWTEPARRARGEGVTRPRRVRPPPPFAGRAELLDALVRPLAIAARGGPPTLLAVEGPPAVGKTRLLQELELRLAADGVRVEWLRPAARRWEEGRDAVAASLRAQPGVVLVDDGDRLDPAWLELLEAATLVDAGAPLGVLLVGSPFLERRPHYGDRAGLHRRFRLEALEAPEAETLLRELIQPVEFVPAELVAQLGERTHGLPGLMVELVRSLEASGALAQDPLTSEWRLSPDALAVRAGGSLLEVLAGSALSSLPADFRDVARLCAVIGDAPVDRLARALAQLPPEWSAATLDALRAVERIAASGLLVLEGAGYRFRQRLVATALEDSLSAGARRLLHRAAWRSADAAARPAQRAHHAQLAGELAAAQSEYVSAAEQALCARRDVDAEALLGSALALPGGSDPARAGWLWLRARARRRNHRFAEALEDLAQAEALGPSRVLRTELGLERATALDWLEEWEPSAAAAEAAGRWAVATTVPRGTWTRLRLADARGVLRSGRWAEAAAALETLIPEAARQDVECEVVARALRGAALALGQRLDEARVEFATAVVRCEAERDPVHLGVVLCNRVLLHLAEDEVDAALDDLRGAVRLAREHGLPQNERWSSHNLAQFLTWLRQPAQALPLAERAHALGSRFYGERLAPTAQLLLARLRLAVGDAAGARNLLTPWQQRPDSLPPSERAQLELCLLWLEEAPAARWWALCESPAPLPPDERTDLWVEAALALRALGDETGSAGCLERATAHAPQGSARLWQRVLRRVFPAQPLQQAAAESSPGGDDV